MKLKRSYQPSRLQQSFMADDGPLGMVSTFKSQKLDGDTVKGAWRRKVNQYVLGLEEQSIFGRRSDSSAQRAIVSQQGERQMMDVDPSHSSRSHYPFYPQQHRPYIHKCWT